MFSAWSELHSQVQLHENPGNVMNKHVNAADESDLKS
jgi:hypothetical protein